VSEPEESFDDLLFDPFVVVGIWANSTRVHRGRHEFTLDFLRHVPDRPRPVLVTRAALPPGVAFELLDQLNEAWRSYSEWSMPKEPEDG